LECEVWHPTTLIRKNQPKKKKREKDVLGDVGRTRAKKKKMGRTSSGIVEYCMRKKTGKVGQRGQPKRRSWSRSPPSSVSPGHTVFFHVRRQNGAGAQRGQDFSRMKGQRSRDCIGWEELQKVRVRDGRAREQRALRERARREHWRKRWLKVQTWVREKDYQRRENARTREPSPLTPRRNIEESSSPETWTTKRRSW